MDFRRQVVEEDQDTMRVLICACRLQAVFILKPCGHVTLCYIIHAVLCDSQLSLVTLPPDWLKLGYLMINGVDDHPYLTGDAHFKTDQATGDMYKLCI